MHSVPRGVGVPERVGADAVPDALGPARGRLLPACCALAATVAAHLLLGRRTLLSVGLGTFVFVLLVNLSP